MAISGVGAAIGELTGLAGSALQLDLFVMLLTPCQPRRNRARQIQRVLSRSRHCLCYSFLPLPDLR